MDGFAGSPVNPRTAPGPLPGTKKGTKKTRGRPKGANVKSATYRLPEEFLEEIAMQARKQERAQTTIVRRALEAHLKTLKEEGEEED